MKITKNECIKMMEQVMIKLIDAGHTGVYEGVVWTRGNLAFVNLDLDNKVVTDTDSTSTMPDEMEYTNISISIPKIFKSAFDEDLLWVDDRGCPDKITASARINDRLVGFVCTNNERIVPYPRVMFSILDPEYNALVSCSSVELANRMGTNPPTE